MMDLTINGTWTEETNSAGYYQGSTHHGAFQLLSDPTGRPPQLQGNVPLKRLV